MSRATDYALWRLEKGDKKEAQKRLEQLSKTGAVTEYVKLADALGQYGLANADTPGGESTG